MKPWALVTPASRGIGFALTKHLLKTTNLPVVATARKDLDKVKSDLLDGVTGVDEKRLTVLNLDVLDESSIEDAAKRCAELHPKQEQHLHVTFAIPGILHPEKSPAQISADDALSTFRVNTIGPLLLMKHFHGFLPSKKQQPGNNGTDDEIWKGLNPNHATWATMSARVGSISDNQLGGWYSYRASKAAVNQLVKTFDNYLKTSSGESAIAIGLHPGTVKTGLSKEFWGSVKKEKLFEPDWVAERLVSIVAGRDNIGLEGRGKCWDWDRKEVQP